MGWGSLLSNLLKKGFRITFNRPWPGEKDLPYPNYEPDISSKTINEEIAPKQKKEE